MIDSYALRSWAKRESSRLYFRMVLFSKSGSMQPRRLYNCAIRAEVSNYSSSFFCRSLVLISLFMSFLLAISSIFVIPALVDTCMMPHFFLRYFKVTVINFSRQPAWLIGWFVAIFCVYLSFWFFLLCLFSYGATNVTAA